MVYTNWRCPSCNALVEGGVSSLDTDDALCPACQYAKAHPPSPAPDADGGAAFVAAVDALIAAVGGEYPSDAETAARDALLAAHAEAVAAEREQADAAEEKVAGWWGDAVRVVNAAVAEGRASAFAEVTEAIEALALGAWNGSVSVSCHGTPPELRWSAGSSKTRATDDLVRVTPTAAILAAAAALSDDAGGEA